MWVARDLGYRGGRRTGIPITDEFHLQQAGAMMGGVELVRATLGAPVAERTSTVVWDMLGRIGEPILLWNAFPLHPHDADSRSPIGATLAQSVRRPGRSPWR